VFTSGSRLAILLAAVVALAATATACTLHPPTVNRRPPPSATRPPGVVTSTMQSRRFTLTMDVVPATVGTNEIHVYASGPGGQDPGVMEWRITATNSARGLGPINAAVLPITTSHAIGQIDVPATGMWRFSATVRAKGTDEDVVYADFRIS
jgi:copper transport protein